MAYNFGVCVLQALKLRIVQCINTLFIKHRKPSVQLVNKQEVGSNLPICVLFIYMK